MSAIIGLFLGGLLSRVAGPIAQDYFENETDLGRRIGKRKEEKEVAKEERAFQQKIKMSEHDHNQRLKELKIQIEARRKDTENQYYLSMTDANMRTFLKECWPLRNPFDAPIAMEPIYDESTNFLSRCKLKTVMTSNQNEIVPLRFISALVDGAYQFSPTINSELSLFLVNNYSANGENAVVSEIGAWRNDIPVNDASISYLFKGMKGQPVMILVPEFLDNGSMLRFKVWSWGLGEKLTYPVGFDFGWLDLRTLYNRIVASETKKMHYMLEKVHLSSTSKQLDANEKIIFTLLKNKENLSSEEKDALLSLLVTPMEINSLIRKKFSNVLSNVFKAIVAMYSDGYHLIEYGTMPKLPYVLGEMQNISFMFPYISAYYVSLINASLIKGVITTCQAVNVQLSLAESMSRISTNKESTTELIESVRILNTENNDMDSHQKAIKRLRDLSSDTNSKSIGNG